MEAEEKAVSFDSKITPEDMFEFHMSHAFSTSQGWIAAVFGIVGITAGIVTFGKIDTFYSVSYIVLGIVFLIYLPLIFKRRARVQVESSEVLKNTLHYRFSDEGVGVRTDVPLAEDTSDEKAAEAVIDTSKQEALLPWDMVYKVTGTKNELLIYSSRINAYVIPRRDIGEHETALREVLSEHLPAHRMKWK